MDYKKAVEAALKGNESAFSALYESTQRDMYYIALKYMKNEEDAMDVLQDSYIKAWQSLATLKDPASFRAWFGRIVANTAKNALAKKRPMLFPSLREKMMRESSLLLISRTRNQNFSLSGAIHRKKLRSWCMS